MIPPQRAAARVCGARIDRSRRRPADPPQKPPAGLVLRDVGIFRSENRRVVLARDFPSRLAAATSAAMPPHRAQSPAPPSRAASRTAPESRHGERPRAHHDQPHEGECNRKAGRLQAAAAEASSRARSCGEKLTTETRRSQSERRAISSSHGMKHR